MGSTVAPYITIIILVTGIAGGLIIVITVILVCKFCVEKKPDIGRRQYSSCASRSSERQFRFLQRFETVNSDVFAEPSVNSVEFVPVGSRFNDELRGSSPLDETEEVNETTKLTSDYERSALYDTKADSRTADAAEQIDEYSKVNGERRVSFQLDNLPELTSSYLKKGRRYTEGDFHYLKNARIAKPSKSLLKQYSLAEQMLTRESSTESGDSKPEHHVVDIYTCLDSGVRNIDSPSPPEKLSQTEVAAEIHHHHNGSKPKTIGDMSLSDRQRYHKALGAFRGAGRRNHSLSLDINQCLLPVCSKLARKSKSYEASIDYDAFKITEFNNGVCCNNEYEALSEVGSPSPSIVRYHDTGSLEKLNETHDEYWGDFSNSTNIPDESDDTETLNGAQVYRELWNLRTTLEEEEECSDTIRMEDTVSSDHSPDRELNLGDLAQYRDANGNISPKMIIDEPGPPGDYLLHPTYETRKQSYRTMLLTKRVKCAEQAGGGSVENSFDSFETDGDVSDTSRYEVTTTSFESTTDNTDSTTESQTNRLRQMKADSGYKSIETQHTQGEQEAANRECLVVEPKSETHKFVPPRSLSEGSPTIDQYNEMAKDSNFDRKSARTASRKRREYGREKHVMRVHESLTEPETESFLPSGDSFDESAVPHKGSIFSRFFRSQSRERKSRLLVRDFSIDEKSNKIFNEFVRPDPRLDISPKRGHHRHRFHRKQTEPPTHPDDKKKHDRLLPDMRCASLGSDSSVGSARRISPQDSIEEEEYEDEISKQDVRRKTEPVLHTQAIQEIPIIKLPEEEVRDT